MGVRFLATGMVALALLLAGCSDHRNEEFCDNLCACIDEANLADCAYQCTTSLESADQGSSGPPVVTDECFSCVATTSCERIETSCETPCENLQNGLDRLQQIESGESSDPTN